MSKPNLVDVLDVVRMKAEATALYDEIDRRIAGMMAEYGAGRYDYDVVDYIESSSLPGEFVLDLVESGRYLKFELEDNVGKLASGEAVWKSVGLKPVSFSSGSLKRCPDSLK